MNLYGLSLLITTLVQVWCQQNPIITSISQNIIADVGQNVLLKCSVQYTRNFPVMWVKKNKGSDLFISSNKHISFPDRRYSLTSDEGSNTYQLQIQGITQTDNGLYQCRIQISGTTEITADVYLLVRQQPTISDNSTRSVLKSQGAYVELFCHASGFPQPKITWHRENSKVLPSGGAVHKGNSLVIPNIQKEHRGTYYCVADNGVGAGAKRNIRVDVEFVPVIKALRPKVGQALTYDMELQCRVEAYPSPSIEWVKDNTLLINNQHYGLSSFATTDQTTDTTLKVITVQKDQYGDYICRAINKLGTAEAKINLYEEFVAKCPPACDVQITTTNGNEQMLASPFNFAVAVLVSVLTSICAQLY